MKKNKFSTYFIFISFFTFLTILTSVIQKSYFSFRKPQILVENNALLKEINPNLDLSVLSTIESKNKNIEESLDFSIVKTEGSSNITPTITQQSIATPTSSQNNILNQNQ